MIASKVDSTPNLRTILYTVATLKPVTVELTLNMLSRHTHAASVCMQQSGQMSLTTSTHAGGWRWGWGLGAASVYTVIKKQGSSCMQGASTCTAEWVLLI